MAYSCSTKGHDFQRVSDVQVCCTKCGEWRTAPSLTYPLPVYPQWPWYQPVWWPPVTIWSGTSTVSGSVSIGSTTTYDADTYSTPT